MSNKKLFLLGQSVLCILTAALFAAAIVTIYVEGSAYQAAGHPSEWIFTREKVVSRIMPLLPLLFLSIAMTVFGLMRGIRDEDACKPAKDVDIAAKEAGMAWTPPSQRTDPAKLRRQNLLWCALMAAAVVMVLLGTFNGSMKDVLVKAIKICTECVGLG